MSNFVKTGFVLTIIAGIIFAPWLLIWAMNTLFPLTIPYTFKTYLAGLVMLMFVNTGYYSSKKG